MRYEDISFYNEYFRSLEDFRLTKEFEQGEHLYKGTIESIGSIHPISIDVEIPANFPHHKLVFWTQSLSGYPHLIYGVDPYLKKDIDKTRGWFCLNTPFADSAQKQLNLEIARLREWLKRYLSEELPPHITNPDVIDALNRANGFNWEYRDEMQERSHQLGLTFVGNFGTKEEDFPKKSGVLHCVRRTTRNGQFHIFAFRNSSFTDLEIPYVIVDSFCGRDALSSFFQLREFYHWDAEQQEKLLPDFHLQDKHDLSGRPLPMSGWLEVVKENRDRIVIEPEDLPAVDATIRKVEEELENVQRGERSVFDSLLFPNNDDPDFEEKMEEYYLREDEFERYMLDLHFFALGFAENGEITWVLFWTNRDSKQFDRVTYKFGNFTFTSRSQNGEEHTHEQMASLTVKRFRDVALSYYVADHIDYRKYFGRGCYCPELTEKKIAIIGAGAIGSSLATTLVRGGAMQIDIWDGDHIAPGNLCRASYSGKHIGQNKARALAEQLEHISPFCKVTPHAEDLYSNINYKSQEEVIKQIADYDIIFDCAASPELLHFLSYAIPDKLLISLGISNHAANLFCISSKNGSAYETLRACLAKVEQDTDNYYVEGTGCFDPTFLASCSDINALLNMAIRDVNRSLADGKVPDSIVYSYAERGIVADKIHCYSLYDKSIHLVISAETELDAMELPDATDGKLSAVCGCYSSDGRYIYVTHFCPAEELPWLKKQSEDVLEYLGEYRYSHVAPGEFSDAQLAEMAEKAADSEINTYNPLLVLRNPDGSLSFFLYIDDALEEFEMEIQVPEDTETLEYEDSYGRQERSMLGTRIGLCAFDGHKDLISIKIPDSVTEICWYAFRGCTGLTSIVIPDSVTEIGGHAFSGCTGLTSVKISNSLTAIGEGAFFGCTGLTFIEIPESVTAIGEEAFSGCTGLTSVKIPKSVTTIYGGAFCGCTNLTLYVPRSCNVDLFGVKEVIYYEPR